MLLSVRPGRSKALGHTASLAPCLLLVAACPLDANGGLLGAATALLLGTAGHLLSRTVPRGTWAIMPTRWRTPVAVLDSKVCFAGQGRWRQARLAGWQLQLGQMGGSTFN